MGLSDMVPDLRKVVFFTKGKETHKNKNTCVFFFSIETTCDLEGLGWSSIILV